MMKLLLLAALCACNQLLAIDQTALRDGAGPDAPFACPSIGTAPVYGRTLHQIPGRNCREYTISAATGRAMAICYPNGPGWNKDSVIAEGPIDAELAPILSAVPPVQLDSPRLTPDGERFYVQKYDGSATTVIEQYARQGDRWVLAKTAPFRVDETSTIAATPTGDRILLEQGGDWEEWAEINGTWTYLTTHTRVQLDVGAIGVPDLSLDGRRLLFTGTATGEYRPRMFYADRASVDLPFGRAVPLQGVPNSYRTVFMTEDCGRVYLFGLERLFYVNQ